MNTKEKIYQNKELIEKMYCVEGRSKSFIARTLSVDRRVLGKTVNNEWKLTQAKVKGISPNNEAFYNKNKKKIKEFLLKGYTLKQIGKELGVEQRRIRYITDFDSELGEIVDHNDLTRREKWKVQREKKNERLMDNSSLKYAPEDLPGEIWKPLDINDNYLISNLARVKSFKKTYNEYVLLSTYTNKFNGYNYFSVSTKSGERKTIRLCRAVAAHFCKGQSSVRNQVNHIDGNKTNDVYTNLEWVSPEENQMHSLNVLNNPRNNYKCNQYTTSIEKYVYKSKYEFNTIVALSKFLGKSETQTRRYIKDAKKNNIEIIYKKQ